MKTSLFLLLYSGALFARRRLIYIIVPVFFIFGCNEKKNQKSICPGEYLRDCAIIKIKKIKAEIKVTLDREKVMDCGVSMTSLQYKLRHVDLGSVKALQQYLIEGTDGKAHPLSEFAEISLGITVTYEYPWDKNPFNIF